MEVRGGGENAVKKNEETKDAVFLFNFFFSLLNHWL